MREVVYTGDPIEAAEEFTRRLKAELGEELDAVVLYGSVARGDAGPDSDVNVLVVARETKESWATVSAVGFDLYDESDFTLPLMDLPMDTELFKQMANEGSPFTKKVISEGKVLYDNGTFGRFRKGSARVG